MIPEHEAYVEHARGRTWYRVVGEGADGRDPLVCLHGGPGSTHNYFALLERLAEDGRAVVLYDQLGCGRSERPKGIDWSVRVFLDELAALREKLGLERIHLLGTSWGGMLALEHALAGAAGLTSLVLSSTLASIDEWVAEAKRLRAELPAGVVATLDRHEEAGDYDAPEYRAALDVFDDRYVRRGALGRPELELMKAGLGKESYRAMVGPNEWTVTGALRGWDVRDRLGEIAVPALVARGRFDMCTERIAATLLSGLRDAREAVFEESSHMPALEEPERYREVVGAFLREAERPVDTAPATP
ncbi:MAG TPA: proline iminopeptidase-family hydrolase [Gaiellaceae bacterium]|nr:proline iminopeptidase-family hydrolase [Gaiellaceae bacterium]